MKVTRITTLVVQRYLEAINCPRSLAVWLLYKHNEHQQLVDLDISPSDFIDSDEFRNAYLATKFLSKANFLKTNIDLKEKAIEVFRQSELKCQQTNQNLNDPLFFFNNGYEDVIFTARRKISFMLGDVDIEQLLDAGDFGPGVSLLNKKDTSRPNKYQTESDISTQLSILLQDVNYFFPESTWAPELKLVDYNKVVTVPKNSKTDRTIAIEPGLSLWFQKAIGSTIRQRLLRVGVDLNQRKQLADNCRLAREASIKGHLATVDFSSASDTIARKLVEILLPSDWYYLLSSARSKLYKSENGLELYSKFSSMGNGYTFELESLIFYALAYAVCVCRGYSTKGLSIYGDDLIIDVDAFDDFSTVSKLCGFTVNRSKSFKDGYFRESCGSHWFEGRDCKPFYLRKVIKDERDVYKVANGIRRLAHRSYYYGCDSRFRACWRLLRSEVPQLMRFFISEGFGDGGFIGNFDEALPKVAGRGIEGFYVKHLAFTPVKVHHDSNGLLQARLKTRSQEISYGNSEPLRGRGRWTRKRLLIPQWYDLGPWIRG